ncbi:unnamed protein product [Paramecium primaurelia]|uniref:Uncharacterized protein n=1 Tax=Paramecium primaurelia TaxID=5886 RepID=A0A8S1N615_PARPR|nr:unnamed protein product [Paramecium primaurelia]
MNSQRIDEYTFQNTNEKIHIFGPSLSECYMQVKNLEDETKSQQIVTFKQQNDVFIVENWKNYNIDVCNPAYQTQLNKKQKNQCCTIF